MSPRPRLRRRVRFQPDITFFKPAGVMLRDLKEISLTFEELEALRLKDFLSLNQKEAAEKMKISQPTFHRVLLAARKKVAEAIVNGKAIKIEGGDFKMLKPKISRSPTELNGFCKCSKCGNEKKHVRGQPCYKIKCSKCGTLMTRK